MAECPICHGPCLEEPSRPAKPKPDGASQPTTVSGDEVSGGRGTPTNAGLGPERSA